MNSSILIKNLLNTTTRSYVSLSSKAPRDLIKNQKVQPKTEEEIRRFVVGLSTMCRDGKLKPSTSREQVVSHFSNYKTNEAFNREIVNSILDKRTKSITNKYGESVLEWIY